MHVYSQTLLHTGTRKKDRVLGQLQYGVMSVRKVPQEYRGRGWFATKSGSIHLLALLLLLRIGIPKLQLCADRMAFIGKGWSQTKLAMTADWMD